MKLNLNSAVLATVISYASLALVACDSSEKHFQFGGGIDPSIFSKYPSACKKDPITGEFPAGDSTDALATYEVSGDYGLGTLSRCVFADINTVWARAASDNFMLGGDAKTKSVLTASVDSSQLEVGTLWKFSTAWTSEDFITVKWNVDYYHSLLNGTLAEPTQVKIDYQMTDIDTGFAITHWVGAAILQKVADNVTSVIVRSELNTAQSDDNDKANALSAATGLMRSLNEADPDFERLKKMTK